MKKKRILKIILLSYCIIILLLIGILVLLKIKNTYNAGITNQQIKQYDVLNPPDLDSSWQQFQSPYGYQVSYPHDWKLLAHSPYDYDGIQMIRIASPRAYSFAKARKEKQGNIANEKLAPLLHITSYDSFDGFKKNLTTDNKVPGSNLEQIAENLSKTEDYYNVYTQPFVFYVGPNKAYAVGKLFMDSNGNQLDTRQLMIFLENSGFYYNIIFNDIEAITKLGNEEMKILSSFKLIKPTCTKIMQLHIKDGDLTYYKNTDMGLTLMVPDNWNIKEENNNLIFASPENMIFQEWCELEFCEGPLQDFSIIKYDNFNKFIEANGYAGMAEVSDIASYLKDRKKVDFELRSYGKININKYPAFEAELGGMCSSYMVLINYKSKVYEIDFECSENRASLSEVEKKVLNSIEFL